MRVYSQHEIGDIVDMAAFNADPLSFGPGEERDRVIAVQARTMKTVIVYRRFLKIPAGAFDVCEESIDRRSVWIDQSPQRLDIHTQSRHLRTMTFSHSELRAATDSEEE
jgi:hypothetical protein